MKLAPAALVGLVFLAGCTAVPVATLVRLGGFDEKRLATLDPAVMRVRVAAPPGFVIDPGHTRLAVRLRSGEDKRTEEFELAATLRQDGRRPGGPFAPDIPVEETTLRLSPASQNAFRRLQAFLLGHAADQIDLEVNVGLEKAPPGATQLTVWIDVMLSPGEGYVPLVDGGRIELNKTKVY